MLKKLYGLFIYKLQMTSYFSIMERVSGFLLLSVIYYFFLSEVFVNSFFFSFSYSFIFYIFIFLVLFFFSFHIVNGLRIYFMSLYYYINLKKQPLSLDTLFSFSLLEKHSFFKNILSFLKSFLGYIRIFVVKSNYFFLIFIFLVYFLLIFFVLV